MIAGLRLLPPALVAAGGLYAAVRLYVLIDTYAVNVFMWDQWIVVRAALAASPIEAFGEPSLAKMLTWDFPSIPFWMQPAGWFMGLGGPFTELVYGMTRWNTRIEGFAIYGVVLGATLCALRLKTVLFGPLAVSDVVIPLLFLTPRQHETFIFVPFVSHAVLPLLLVILYCFCWARERTAARYAAIVGINAVTIFTGNGSLLGVLTPPLLALDALAALRSGRRRSALAAGTAMALAIATLGVWLKMLTFGVGMPYCFKFPHEPIADYALFAAHSVRYFLGMESAGLVAVSAGLLGLLTVAAAGLRQVVALARGAAADAGRRWVVLILTSYSLAFILSSAVFRVCFGVHSGATSRYGTLLIPAFLALYFAALMIGSPLSRRIVVVAFLGLVMAGPSRVTTEQNVMMAFIRDTKASWRDCYLAERIVTCQTSTSFTVAPPGMFEELQLQWQMELLERHRLGFFADRR